MIPPFNSEGNLPPGIHEATWEELVDRFGTNDHRLRLLRGLRKALLSLKASGCRTAYIDGSFVSAKESPRDYDACWEMEGINIDLLDRVMYDFDDPNIVFIQKAKYRGELYPVDSSDTSVNWSFLKHFQTDKNTGNPKGIVALDLRRLLP